MIRTFLSLLRGEGLRARALRSSGLTFVNIAGGQGLRLVSNLILTRILFPEAFGLMALVNIAMAGLAMFSDVGLRAVVVRDPRGDDPVFLNTAWTLQVVRGAIIWAATALIAAPLAAFYDEPMLKVLLPVAGISATIAGFNATAMVTAGRHLRFGRLTAMMLGAQAISIVAMVTFAWFLQSVWALVLGGLVGSLVTMILSHTVLPGPRNRFQIDRPMARDILSFGKFVFIATMATFLLAQGDRAILGKFVPLDELALYSIAFFLGNAPVLIGQALNERVLFPLYAKLPPAASAENRAKIARSRRLVTSCLLAGMTIPALAGIWIIEILYDPRYHAAGPLLVLIAIGAMPGMIVQPYGASMLAAGRSDHHAVITVTRAVVRLGLMIVAAPAYGAAGVALAPALADIVTYPLVAALTRPIRSLDLASDLGFGALAVAIATLTLWLNFGAIAGLFPGF